MRFAECALIGGLATERCRKAADRGLLHRGEPGYGDFAYTLRAHSWNMLCEVNPIEQVSSHSNSCRVSKSEHRAVIMLLWG